MTEITSYFKCKPLPSMFKFTGLLLVCFLLLSSSVCAQNNNPISIIWSGGVGCQVYQTGEPPRDEKEPLFLEDILDGDCFRVCENSYIYYQLQNVPIGSTVVWSSIGGSISSSTNTSCSVIWGSFGMGSLSFQITTGSTISSKTICFEKIIGPIADFEVLPFTTGEGNYICLCRSINLLYQSISSQWRYCHCILFLGFWRQYNINS